MTLLLAMMSTYHSMAELLAATLTAELKSMFVVGKVEAARLTPTSPKKKKQIDIITLQKVKRKAFQLR